MHKYKVKLEYDGSMYSGWQRQKGCITIQEIIEDKLTFFLGENVKIFGSGRTDAGVHAINQYFSFKTPRDLPEKAYVFGLNSFLPNDIRIKSAERVSDEFHACFSAKKKTYLYKILNRNEPTALYTNRAWHIREPLDIEKMNDSSNKIIGTHDFSSFRAALCSRKNPVRTVYEAKWWKDDEFVNFTITANGFLHNMVRIIVGNIVEIGMGKKSPEQFDNIIRTCDRRKAGRTAPPQGLYLFDVYY